MADEKELEFEIPVMDAKSGQIKRVVIGSKPAVVSKPPPPPPAPSRPPPAPRVPELVPEERVMKVPQPPLRQKFQNPNTKLQTTTPADSQLQTSDFKLQSLSPTPGAAEQRSRTTDVYARLAEDIVRESGITLSPSLYERLLTIVLSRLKDVRDAMETKDILIRPADKGGVGLSVADADKLAAVLEPRLKKLTDELAVRQKQKTTEALQAETAKTAVRAEQREETDERSRQAIYEAITGLPAKKPKPKSPKLPTSNFQLPAPPPAPAPPPPRPVVRDVAAPPARLTGPVEELKALSLADFRRLSKNPSEAALKIRDKIRLLGEESVSKKAEGAAAWQTSEPYRLYAAAIGQSLEARKPVTSFLATLTQDEFNAIMELNNLLKE